MDDELGLRQKLRKIEALFAGAATPGEKAAAGAAADRIRARLRQFAQAERAVEVRFSISDPWSRRLFIALCRRYGLRPYRHARMKRQTVLVRAPRSFLNSVLWPEFVQIDAALMEFLAHVTDKVIRDAVFKETGEAEEVSESGRPG
jgi:hypothetical protein